MINNKISKIYHNNSLIEELLFSGFSFINRGFVFLLLLILANYISPSEYGYLNLFNTVVVVIGFIAMSTEGYFSISYFNRGDYDYKSFFSEIILIDFITSSVFGLILLACSDKISTILSLPDNSLYIAVVIVVFTIFQNRNLDFFRLRKKVWFYGIFSCSNALKNFIIVFVKSFSLWWEGRFYAQLVSI